MSPQSLEQKIITAFDKVPGTKQYKVKPGKAKDELFDAMAEVSSILYSQPAFALEDIHQELQTVMQSCGIHFNPALFDRQKEIFALHVICLISGTSYLLPDKDTATCMISVDNETREVRSTADAQSPSFGNIQINGFIKLQRASGATIDMAFPAISSSMSADLYCESDLFQPLVLDVGVPLQYEKFAPPEILTVSENGKLTAARLT